MGTVAVLFPYPILDMWVEWETATGPQGADGSGGTASTSSHPRGSRTHTEGGLGCQETEAWEWTLLQVIKKMIAETSSGGVTSLSKSPCTLCPSGVWVILG